jgi:hypothetical protein
MDYVSIMWCAFDRRFLCVTSYPEAGLSIATCRKGREQNEDP